MTSFSKHPRHFCFPPQATPTEKLGHMLTYLGHTTSSNLGRMADLNEFHGAHLCIKRKLEIRNAAFEITAIVRVEQPCRSVGLLFFEIGKGESKLRDDCVIKTNAS